MTTKKTSRQIQGDFYRLLQHSELAENVSGSVYRSGTRPRDSRKEDVVVIHTAGITAEVSEGVVTVNIFVPDIDPYKNGVLVEDIGRTEQIEAMAQRWVESLNYANSGYITSLNRIITTDYEAEIHQHFVVVKLNYKYY